MKFILREKGAYLASRRSAAEIRDKIDVALLAGPVELDLVGVESISESFADELFGVLAKRRTLEGLFQNLGVTGASDIVVKSIVRAIRYRLENDGTWSDPSIAKLAAIKALSNRKAAHCF